MEFTSIIVFFQQIFIGIYMFLDRAITIRFGEYTVSFFEVLLGLIGISFVVSVFWKGAKA